MTILLFRRLPRVILTNYLNAVRSNCKPLFHLQSGCALLATLLIFFFWSVNVESANAYTGKVIDAATQQPISGAIVTLGSTSVHTKKDGSFKIDGNGDQIGIRAYGYLRHQLALPQSYNEQLEILLHSFTPRAVYLSLSSIDDFPLREEVVDLLYTTQINALVIDVKNEQGRTIAFPNHVPLKGRNSLGGNNGTADMWKLVNRLLQNGMYAIARIPVFMDNYLAETHPELALKTEDGSILRDNNGIAWTDPRNKTVWDYNIAIAVEAARLGFDEIQFDYIRFPSVTYAQKQTDEVRRAAIRGFLAEARTALMPYNVFVAADVFGYASWDPNDTNIGQKLEDIATEVDYICLMLYPSSFKHGIPAARMPLDHPEKIVNLSLRRAQQRTGLSSVRFRPWLQAFRDHNFDHRPFQRPEIIAQINAAENFGTNGWMLWHPRSIYVMEHLPRIIKVSQTAH